jgi:type IV pilus assembly protein PilE
MKKSFGFSLIELLTTLSIAAIIAAFCLPLYTQYLTKTHRLEAQTILSKLAIEMEKFHIEHNTYESATLDGLGFSENIAKNNYRLSIQSTQNDYTLFAKRTGKQEEIILYSTGRKKGWQE